MITRPSTTTELKELLIEIFVNRQNKVTKVSDESVLNAIFYGIAKVAQKAEKDIAITESRLFPDNASGEILDQVASTFGISPRFGASGSSTYVRVFADPGTQYTIAGHTFSSTSGIQFQVEEDTTVDTTGFAYIKVRSVDTGAKTNVNAISINTVSPEPTGHRSVTNEYAAFGGRDAEQDDVFRQRIKDNPNVVAQRTVANLVEVFRGINNDVLDVIREGISTDGKLILSVVSQNGVDFTSTELDGLLEGVVNFLSLTELRQTGDNFSVQIKNVEWFPIDVDFRLDIFNNFNPDDVRKDIQTQFSKQLDFRFWKSTDRVEWDDLLGIVKNVNGVRFVPDQFFSPRVDISVPNTMLPRFRSFIMRDLQGNIISDSQGILSPVFYPVQ